MLSVDWVKQISRSILLLFFFLDFVVEFQLQSDDPVQKNLNAVRSSSAHSGSLYQIRLATMNKATNKSPSKTKGKSNKSFVSNGTNKNISNHSDEMIENPNILRIPLRPSSARNQHDEIINEKRLVEDTYMYVCLYVCMRTNFWNTFEIDRNNIVCDFLFTTINYHHRRHYYLHFDKSTLNLMDMSTHMCFQCSQHTWEHLYV